MLSGSVVLPGAGADDEVGAAGDRARAGGDRRDGLVDGGAPW